LKKLKQFTVSGTGIGRFLLSISFRLMLFNIILVFLPTASVFYLDTYEKQLLESQEKSMVQQARLLSASLSNSGELDMEKSKKVLINLNGRTEARLRIVDTQGLLIADSSTSYKVEVQNDNESYSKMSRSISPLNKDSILYRIAVFPVRLYRKLLNPPLPVGAESFYNSTELFQGLEIKTALDGEYGAVTRLSSDGQRSVSLYIAIPIVDSDLVIGAVLCSQSTYRILQDMYEIRLILLKIFLWSFIFALLISIFLSYSISFRVRRLRNDAESIRTGRGKLEGYFTPSLIMDEIGELSYSLKDLTLRLDKHLEYTASFIQDFSHEFKNPLSVVRTAAEMITDSDKEQQARFLYLIDQNSKRMEQLLEGIRELSIIDKDLEEEIKEDIDIRDLLENIISGFKIKYTNKEWRINNLLNIFYVFASKDKLERVFINILENANSFALSDSTIQINLDNNSQNNQITIEIINVGPQIPSGDLERIFDRFYTNRISGEQNHNGLGLAITKSILDNYNGSIKVINTKNGVCFVVDLPIK
jgi:two-component system, OmpR family, sensor histidine kinase ChvG